MNVAARTIAPSLTMKRHLKAPVSRVFAAWTEATTIARWFGPSADAQVTVEADVRVGGRYRFELNETNGDRHCVLGTYREIVADRRLVFTWAWESMPERESLVTVEFAATEGGTMLTLTHAQFADEEAKGRHEHGWAGTLDRLEKALA